MRPLYPGPPSMLAVECRATMLTTFPSPQQITSIAQVLLLVVNNSSTSNSKKKIMCNFDSLSGTGPRHTMF